MNERRLSSRTRHLLMVSAFLGAVVTSALANQGFDWELYFPLDDPILFKVEMFDQEDPDAETPDGPRTIIQVCRGGMSAGTFEIESAEARTESTNATEGTLLGVRFVTADDGNNDGNIDSSEWTLIDSATAVSQGGWTVAELPAFFVSAFKDLYAIEYDWEDPDGTRWTSGEFVANENVTREELSPWAIGPPSE